MLAPITSSAESAAKDVIDRLQRMGLLSPVLHAMLRLPVAEDIQSGVCMCGRGRGGHCDDMLHAMLCCIVSNRAGGGERYAESSDDVKWKGEKWVTARAQEVVVEGSKCVSGLPPSEQDIPLALK